MSKAIEFITHEIKEAVFPTLFFMVVFETGLVTRALILEPYEITPVGVTIAFVGAITVAKAILLTDRTRFANLFHSSPLAVGVLWKAFIFMSLALLFRFLEELIPLWRQLGSPLAAVTQMKDEVSWPHFWAMQIWFSLSVVLYTAIMALDHHLGRGGLRRLFFSTSKTRSKTM